MKVGRIQHQIDLSELLPGDVELDCDECDEKAKYEIMYEERDSLKSRMVYICGDCESDIEEEQ